MVPAGSSTYIRNGVSGIATDSRGCPCLPIFLSEKGYEYKYPNGESLIDSYNRVCIELDNIISNNDNRTILICSHGGTIRNIITYLISNSYKYHWNFKIDNASVSVVEVDNGFAVINKLNDTIFLK